MMRYIRDLRLIPIALIASACLLALTIADLVLRSSAVTGNDNAAAGDAEISVVRPVPDATQPPGSVLSWAQQMFNFPDGSGSPPVPRPDIAPRLAARDLPDITGSVDADAAAKNAAAKDAKPAPAAIPAKDAKPAPPPNGTVSSIANDGTTLPTGAERAILERLQERRQELDTRARELDIRESLIQGAEKRMDAKLAEIKEAEAQIKVETQQKDEAEASRFKGLVTMYENMKPRDAAKIFDRLDITVLLEVASQIKPQKMSDILAQMSPDTAERLTVELANRAQQSKSGSGNGAGDLPKIQGQPAPQ
jgi:flagellar motility protein MotE (MotC chaperone)